MKTLLLVDAYAMIYRAYYAFIRAPRMNSKGDNTSAIFGFVIALDDLLRKLNPMYVGVAFDPHGATFRHEAYEQYKAQREETPEDIRRAVPIIKRLLEVMNIPVLEVPRFEADDVIGTLAKQAENAGFEVYMATPDKDYGQLVSKHIFMYRMRHTGGFEVLGPKEVCDKYGLQHQSQVIDLLGLMGDASDNIPGCKGVGEKTAVSLLQQFGSIDGILAQIDQIKGALKQKIETQVENIRFSRFLATIRTDVPIVLDEQLLLRKEPDMDGLVALYTELEFTSLLKKLVFPTQPEPKKQPKKQKVESGVLDLFAELESGETQAETHIPQRSPQEEIEARLCQYLLNPEVAYNPVKEPDWAALKSDMALWTLYNEVELPLVSILKEMENAGVRVDVEKLRQGEMQLTAELKELELRIYASVGTQFNINSPRQVGELLFDQLKLDSKAKKSKTGQYATSEEVLVGLKDRHEVVGLILNYRELKKLISTYISTLPSYISEKDGKIHTTYNQTVTATGRLSSSNPNLQNLPIRSERGRMIREAVIADEGCMFLSADYSQIELRLMAHLSQDANMLEAFRRGVDIHAATAAKVFNKPLEEVTKAERSKAKTANFGIIYGISVFGLAERMGVNRAQAKELIDNYFKTYPGIKQYMDLSIEKAKEKQYIETVLHRKRYLPNITSGNAIVRGFAERNAINAPIQGSAADIIKKAMIGIYNRFMKENIKSTMILQVHDELNFNVVKGEEEIVKNIVLEEMQNAYPMSIPLVADYGWGKNWLEAH